MRRAYLDDAHYCSDSKLEAGSPLHSTTPQSGAGYVSIVKLRALALWPRFVLDGPESAAVEGVLYALDGAPVMCAPEPLPVALQATREILAWQETLERERDNYHGQHTLDDLEGGERELSD